MRPCLDRTLSRKLFLAAGLPALGCGLVAVWILQSRGVDPVTHPRSVQHLASAALMILLAITSAAYLIAVRFLVVLPIQRLNAMMRRAQEGDFLFRARLEGRDEIGELATNYNKTLAAITDLHAQRLEDAESIESMQRDLTLKDQVEAQHRTIDQTNQRLELRVRELTLLYDLTRTLGSTLQLDELLKHMTEILGRNLGYEFFELLLADEATGDLVVKTTFGHGTGPIGARVSNPSSGAGWAARQREVLLVRDTRTDPRRPEPLRERPGAAGSALWIPMLFKDDCLGVLELFRPVADAFSEDDFRLLQAVANQAAMAIANARLHQKMVKLSLTDPLTGVQNRRGLFERLQMEIDRAERFAHPMAVAMIDVDRFKRFNDALGHPAGDAALRQMGALLASSVRKVDVLARYGGEEFALVLSRADRAAALEVAEKIRTVIEAASFDAGLARSAGRLTVSVGVAVYPEDARDLATLIDCADAALYCAKREGRNRVRAYEPGMREAPGRQRDILVTTQLEPA
jgi:diguanylate cyclase (GGDEF)-like protein